MLGRAALLGVFVFVSVAWAQPAPITVQGQLKNKANLAAPDGTYGIAFTLWTAQVGGTKVWEEIKSGSEAVVVSAGVFSTVLGTSSPLSPELVSAHAELWLELSVSLEPPLSRQRLFAVPYAISASSVQCSGCIGQEHLDSDSLAELATSLGFVKDGCDGCVSASMIDAEAVGTFQTTSLPWSAITDKPDGFADDVDDQVTSLSWSAITDKPDGFADGKDDGLTELLWSAISGIPDGFADGEDHVLTDAQVDAYAENGPLNLAAGAQVASRPVATRLDASKNAVAGGEYLELKHDLGSNALVVTGWYKDSEERWVAAGIGEGTVAACEACGTGADGTYKPLSNTSLAGGEYDYVSFEIPSGVTVTVTGTAPLVIRSQKDVVISGTLLLSGKDGMSTPCYTNQTFPGGAGGAGGGKGGDSNYVTGVPGGSGSGTGGGKGGAGGSGAGGGGGGGGFGSVGQAGTNSTYQTPLSGGAGGGTYATPQLSPIQGGSGGGAGGYGSGHNCAGGTGGGAGGAVQITAASITVTGQIRADGGKGGTANNAGQNWEDDGGAGGGGSGGGIWLRGDTVNITGTVSAQGGLGGVTQPGSTSYQGGQGGKGGDGRVRVDANTFTGATQPDAYIGETSGLKIEGGVTIIQPDENHVRIYNQSKLPRDLRIVLIH